METKVKNRGWVKNVAIIFLAVMLVLTFFSNTIMNRSLPEVATKNVSSGTITAKIRGTGTVTANQTYDVVINQTRKVQSVQVKVGQEVNTGDVLFILSDTESEELEAAQETLRSLNKQYQVALINAADTDYARENRDIQLAREALEKAEKERDALYVSDTQIAMANENVERAKEEVAAAERDVKRAEDKLQEVGSLTAPDDATLTALKRAVEEKEEELDKAQQALSTAEILYGSMYRDIESAARRKLVYLAETSNEDNYNDMTPSAQKRYIDEKMEYYLPYAETDINDGTLWPYAGEGTQFPEDTGVLPGDSYYVETLANDYALAYREITTCMEKVEVAQKAYDDAAQQLRDARKNDNSDTYNKYAQELEDAQDELEEAQALQAKAEEALSTLKTQLSDYKAAENNVESCQKSLEDLLFSLQQQQKQDNKEAQLEDLEMQDLLSQIAKQQALIEELNTDSTAKEIKADVSGVIQNLNVTAGNTTTAGGVMATIEVPDMGYSMSFSVTNEQARRVRQGDSATVSNYYWGSEITAVLSSIKTDPQNPQSNKLLVFDVSGDVSVGTNLTISVGQKSAEYDFVVPNSAIRSDTNGNFVLVVTAKSSPLGNKYTATRVDVTVLASDDTNTAVTGGLQNGDFVITTSNSPVNNGDRVRMADSQ